MKSGKIFLLFIIFFSLLLAVSAQSQRSKTKELENPGYWETAKGNRMKDTLPYLKEGNPPTNVQEPFKTKEREGVFIVYDAIRGEALRLERKKEYIVVDVHTTADPGYRGRLTIDGDQIKSKNLAVFYGNKVSYGGRTLYDEIRAYNDPNQDTFPVLVIRFMGQDRGAVYLDPMGSGHPLVVVNFSSVSLKK